MGRGFPDPSNPSHPRASPFVGVLFRIGTQGRSWLLPHPYPSSRPAQNGGSGRLGLTVPSTVAGCTCFRELEGAEGARPSDLRGVFPFPRNNLHHSETRRAEATAPRSRSRSSTANPLADSIQRSCSEDLRQKELFVLQGNIRPSPKLHGSKPVSPYRSGAGLPGKSHRANLTP
jgi:hypothetical protein